jgi:hypothetical protein
MVVLLAIIKHLDLAAGLSQELETEESFPISTVTVQIPEKKTF